MIRLLPQFLWWIEPSSAVYGVAQSQTQLKRLSSYSVEHWQISPLPFLRYCGHLTDPQVADCSYTLKRWTIHKHDISFLLTWSITWSWRTLLTCSICKLDPWDMSIYSSMNINLDYHPVSLGQSHSHIMISELGSSLYLFSSSHAPRSYIH